MAACVLGFAEAQGTTAPVTLPSTWFLTREPKQLQLRASVAASMSVAVASCSNMQHHAGYDKLWNAHVAGRSTA